MKQKFCSVLGTDGFVRIHYTEWGDPDNTRVLACAHGLTRNARDFDDLARALADRYRVVCIDFPGRGRSDWLSDASAYNVKFYAQMGATWLAAVGGTQVHWLGTSMGGLVGILLAAQRQVPLVSLIVNDVAPEVPMPALERIADYVGVEFEFDSLQALESHLRLVHAPFGPLDDSQWAHLTAHSYRELPDGRLAFHYDPRIADAFPQALRAGADLWPQWRANSLPTLVLQGTESDVLPEDLAQRMRADQPDCAFVRFAGIGHAPALMDKDQIKTVEDWLAKHHRETQTTEPTAAGRAITH